MTHVRDLLFRYWDLDRRQRYDLMNNLGIEVVDGKEREALVKVAKLNKLSEFEEQLKDKESCVAR